LLLLLLLRLLNQQACEIAFCQLQLLLEAAAAKQLHQRQRQLPSRVGAGCAAAAAVELCALRLCLLLPLLLGLLALTPWTVARYAAAFSAAAAAA
jgi:hypothetical protein